MTKIALRAFTLGLLLVSLAALPAAAQIPPGNDYWVTPANGQTIFEFPEGDVESLCNKVADPSWDHKVALRGIPAAGSDWDTIIARLDYATFVNGVATTRIQVKALSFESISLHETPCGKIHWVVSLAACPQPITKMVIRRFTEKSGIFNANIAVSVEFKATDVAGNYLGSLFYTRELPDTATGGTPWSFGPSGEFRPSMTETNNCIDVLRQKLSTYDPKSDHYYFISDLIAKGQCRKQ